MSSAVHDSSKFIVGIATRGSEAITTISESCRCPFDCAGICSVVDAFSRIAGGALTNAAEDRTIFADHRIVQLARETHGLFGWTLRVASVRAEHIWSCTKFQQRLERELGARGFQVIIAPSRDRGLPGARRLPGEER